MTPARRPLLALAAGALLLAGAVGCDASEHEPEVTADTTVADPEVQMPTTGTSGAQVGDSALVPGDSVDTLRTRGGAPAGEAVPDTAG